jgi:membrane-bound lytic murein transglycosylase D
MAVLSVSCIVSYIKSKQLARSRVSSFPTKKLQSTAIFDNAAALTARRQLRRLCVLACINFTLLGGTALAAPEDFPEPPELQRDVGFWMRVYTEITTEQGFLHDEQNLGVVYGTIDIPSRLSGAARQAVIDNARDVYVSQLRGLADKWRIAAALAALRATQARFGLNPHSPQQALATLGYDPDLLESSAVTGRGAVGELTAPAPGRLPPDVELTATERRLHELFGDEVSPQRIAEAADHVRFQLGQADRFRAGIERSGTWEGHIARTFAAKGLPPELAALPHVESSFNAAAYSKVGAAGLWQFMRSTGRLYMRIDDEVDERLDPFRATEAAAQLLSYNYRLLGSWPLALTAYNHGAAGMRRARDSMGTSDIAVIARNYRGATFGFASRNFYPSFLAVLRIDREPQRYFPGVRRAPEQQSDDVELPAWVPVSAVEAAARIDRVALRAFNPALRDSVWSGERHVPRGYQLHLPRPAGGEPWTLQRLLALLPADQLFAAQVRSRNHVARRGDTLATVARRYRLRSADLAALNGLGTEARLRRGMVLRLPDTRPALWQNPAAVTASQASVARAETANNDTTQPGAAVSLEPLDSSRYRVDEDGCIRMLGAESPGQFAEWLQVPVERLSELNPGLGAAPTAGARMRLDFANVSREDFQQRRQEWHLAMQAAFFDTRRITGSENYTVRPGDTLGAVLQKFGDVPSWLLEQYNPNVELLQLRAGMQLVIPKISP